MIGTRLALSSVMIRDTSSMDVQIARPRGRRTPWLVGSVVLILLTVLAWPIVSRWAAADRSISAERLRFATVARGELIHEFSAQGRIVAAERPTLFATAPGVVDLEVAEGETVIVGQLLARIDSPDLRNVLAQNRAQTEGLRQALTRVRLQTRQAKLVNQQEVDRLEVRLAAAQRGVARNTELQRLGLANIMDLEAAEDELALAELSLEHARQTVEISGEMLDVQVADAELAVRRQELIVADSLRRLDELEVRSPANGMVATLEVADRDAVSVGQALIGVIDLSAFEVDVNIPESYADDVSPGLSAVLIIDGERHEGVLKRVAPEVRNAQVLGRVAFLGDIPTGLRQNQRVSTRLVLERRDSVIKVDRGPFLEAGSGRIVYVLSDGLARRREVEIGAVSVSEVEILSGLEPGEQIVLSDLSAFAGAETVLVR